jgi:hypothetical protein
MKLTKPGALVLLLFISKTALALQCGSAIIDIDDRKDKVYQKCGEPESIQTHNKTIAVSAFDPTRQISFIQYEDIVVDELTYNFGPSRFKQYLRFENNALKEIKDLQRGN